MKTNTVKAIKEYYFKELKAVYSDAEIMILLEIVFEKYLGLNKLQLKLDEEKFMSESELLKFHFALKRLKKQEPIQYVLEEAPFYGLNFYVDANVLIPRPETEELVYLVLKKVKKGSRILEIGTGSGCISIALKKKNSTLQLVAVDVDSKVIKIAKKNAQKNKVNVKFIKQDILKVQEIKESFETSFEVVISNPPYISLSEKVDMSSGVLDYEPSLALFVEDVDPLLFYRKIATLSYSHFEREGQLFFEVNQKYGNEVVDLMTVIGYHSVTLIKDINGNNRMVHGIK